MASIAPEELEEIMQKYHDDAFNEDNCDLGIQRETQKARTRKIRRRGRLKKKSKDLVDLVDLLNETALKGNKKVRIK